MAAKAQAQCGFEDLEHMSVPLSKVQNETATDRLNSVSHHQSETHTIRGTELFTNFANTREFTDSVEFRTHC